jgi:hypothetical protein
LFTKCIGNSSHQRSLWANNNQIGSLGECKLYDLKSVGGHNLRLYLDLPSNTLIARGANNVFARGASSHQSLDDGVLSGTRANNEDLHLREFTLPTIGYLA